MILSLEGENEEVKHSGNFTFLWGEAVGDKATGWGKPSVLLFSYNGWEMCL